MRHEHHFWLFWLVNSAIFYFAPYVFVGLVETGNVRLSSFMASVISGFALTVMVSIAMPAFEKLKIKLNDEWQWALAYLFVNVLGVWLIARYADLTGVGVASAWVSVILGTALNLAQFLAYKFSPAAKK